MGAVEEPDFGAVLADDINVVRIRLASMLQAIDDLTKVAPLHGENLACTAGYVLSMAAIHDSMSGWLVESGMMRVNPDEGGEAE